MLAIHATPKDACRGRLPAQAGSTAALMSVSCTALNQAVPAARHELLATEMSEATGMPASCGPICMAERCMCEPCHESHPRAWAKLGNPHEMAMRLGVHGHALHVEAGKASQCLKPCRSLLATSC